jgi:glycerate dehydrogenase
MVIGTRPGDGRPVRIAALPAFNGGEREYPMKIVVLSGYTLNPGDLSWDPLRRLGELTVYDRTPDGKILQHIADAEVVFTNKVPMTRGILESAKSLRYIGEMATGYNNIDVEAAKELGVAVTNIPSYGTPSVSQMAIALLLELCNHVGAHSEEVEAGAWTRCMDYCFWSYPIIELAGKTMGIIGLGRIGQATARIAMAMGMNVLAYDQCKNAELESESLRYVELDQLLAEAHVISLHCPLTEKTQGIIRADTIARMRDGVMIVNTARGQLVAEKDLAEALSSGKVRGAALDVLAVEPPIADNPLLTAKNCIITPHISWASKESRERLLSIAADNLEKFLAGTPVNLV